MFRSINLISKFLLLLVLLAFPGCESGGSATSGSGGSSSELGSLSLTLNTAAIPRLNQQAGTPDTLIVDILNAQTRQSVHPRATFNFARTQSETFTINQVTPGNLIVSIQIFGSNGSVFFSGERNAQLVPGQPVAVTFTISGGTGGGTDGGTGGGTGGGTTTNSPVFRCIQNADDEQGQPDVDIRDDGYFFVVGRATDASSLNNGSSFDSYGYIHGERFTAAFNGTLPTSLDAANGNNGDFDISQFNTLQQVEGSTSFFDQQAVFPRISMNDDGAAVIAWLDSNPSPSAGGALNSVRDSVIRSVILGQTSITTNNTNGFREPEFVTPANAVPNIAGPFSNLSQPSVSMTNSVGGTAAIDYAFFDTQQQARRLDDGGVSQGTIPPGGAPPVNPTTSNLTEFFNTSVPLAVANRRTDKLQVVVAGRNISFPNRVGAEIPFPPSNFPAFRYVNEGQPSETDGDDVVQHVEVDWFDTTQNIVFVYSIFDDSVGGTGLYARVWNAALSAPVTNEIVVAAAQPGVFNIFPDVAIVDSDQSFLVTWTRRTGTTDTTVLLNRFDVLTSTALLTNPLSVDGGLTEVVPNRNSLSRVATKRNGDAVVVWQTGEAIANTPNVKVFGRLYTNASTGGPASGAGGMF